MTFAAGDGLGAMLCGIRDVLFDLGDGLAVNKRPLGNAGFCALANFQFRDFVEKRF